MVVVVVVAGFVGIDRSVVEIRVRIGPSGRKRAREERGWMTGLRCMHRIASIHPVHPVCSIQGGKLRESKPCAGRTELGSLPYVSSTE